MMIVKALLEGVCLAAGAVWLCENLTFQEKTWFFSPVGKKVDRRLRRYIFNYFL